MINHPDILFILSPQSLDRQIQINMNNSRLNAKGPGSSEQQRGALASGPAAAPSSLAEEAEIQRMFAVMHDDREDMDLGEDDEEMDSDDDDDDDDIEEDFPADGEDDLPTFEQNEESGDEADLQAENFLKAVDPESENVVDSLNDRVIEGSFKRRSGEGKQLSQAVEGGAAVTSSPRGTPGGQKKQVKFENKSVRFDENTAIPSAIHRPMSSKKTASSKSSLDQSEGSRAQGAPMSSTQSLLELEKEIKIHQSEGNFDERSRILIRYCRMANEAAQSVDQRDQKKALALLQQCIKVIRDSASKQTPFDELLYETQNNIARCYNIQGDIEMSLQYLLKAYAHVQNLAGSRDLGSVTILPELSLNICNAYIYEANYPEAIKFANEAVKSSSQCVMQLTRKLDAPISDDPATKAEQERLSELYKSQVKLHIQGYQARGRIYEKMNKFRAAIQEYTKAKSVVEQNFGTNNELFKDAVSQVTAANVNLKTQSYTGRVDGGGVFSNAASMRSSWSTGKKSQKSQKKDPSPDRDVVQITDDVIDIRSLDKSDFDQQSLMQNSVQTEKTTKKGRQLLSNKANRKLRSARGSKPKEIVKKSSSNARRPLRRKSRQYESPLPARQYQPVIRQPPFNSGAAGLGFSHMNHLQAMVRNNDLWKFNHYYTPNMLGYLGYPSFNLERPRSFYHTSIKLNHRPARRMSTPRLRPKAKLQRTKTVVELDKPEDNSQQITKEIEDLKDQLRSRASDPRHDETIKSMQMKQMEQRRSLMEAIEQQKQAMLERQRQEREQARAEREALLLKIQAQKQQQPPPPVIVEKKEVKAEPQPQPVQVPPVHPIYGPAVYDYQVNQWTYPYAQWYGPGGGYQEEEVEVVEEEEAPPEVKESSVQKDFEVKPQPVTSAMAIQTEDEVKIEHHEVALQTQVPDFADFGTSPIKVPSEKAELPSPVVVRPDKRKEGEAASTISRFYKKRIQNRREQAYNTKEQGILYTRKRKYNNLLGAIEIMSMYMVQTPENRCRCLRFTIFNYATKQFSYLGVYDKLEHLDEFDVDILLELAKPSLDRIDFERSPFRFHILSLQSVINTARMGRKPQKEVKLVEKEPPKKEAEVIYVDQPKPKTADMATQLDPPEEDWVLEAEVNEVEEEEVVDEEKDVEISDPVVFSREPSRPEPEAVPLYRPSRPSIEPKVMIIQRKVRQYLLRKKFIALLSCKRELGKRLLYSHMRKVATEKFGAKFFAVSLYRRTQTTTQTGTQMAPGTEYKMPEDKIGGVYYSLEAREQHEHQDAARRGRNDAQTFYFDLRLPDDPAVLKYYLLSGTVLTVDEQTGKIDQLKLIRLKVKVHWALPMRKNKYVAATLSPIDGMGCNLKLQFLLARYPNHLCKVYKRYRYQDEEKERIVKDWKIKVVQLDGALSEDYIVVRRLPCTSSDVERILQTTLEVQHNKRIVPNTILHLFWKIFDIVIYSQKFYDFNQPRFDHQHVNTYFFSQSIGTGRRTPDAQAVNTKRWDPLYEVYIQKMVPKPIQVVPHRYANAAYEKYKATRRRRIGRRQRRSASSSSSSSDDDEDAAKFVDDECFWDEQELVKMQLDEEHAAQSYYKVTITRSTDKQDQDFFRIECDVARWPHPDVEFQYLMENLLLRQKKNAATGEVNIKIAGLKIRNMEYKYSSDYAWIGHVRTTGQLEEHMSQDLQRWRNQNFACTVYNARYQGGGFWIEAVNVDRPHQRAYMRQPTMMGMRGEILKFYIDSMLKIVGSKDEGLKAANVDLSTGFGDNVIERLEFACTPEEFRQRMSRDPEYCHWEYEKLAEEEKPPGFVEPAGPPADEAAAKQAASDAEELRAMREKTRQRKLKQEAAALAKKVRLEKMEEVVKKMQALAVDVKAGKGEAFRLWKRLVIEWERQRAERMEKERQERLLRLGEDLAKFTMPYDMKNTPHAKARPVELSVQINKFTNPNFFRITIENLENTAKQDDTVVMKIMRLPGALKHTERDPKKIKHVFMEKLKVVWQSAEQVDGIPRMLDAFIDNTVVKEQVIHKIVEVKVWDQYHRKRQKKAAEDSEADEALDVDEDELRLIRTDVATIKRILKEMQRRIAAYDQGIEAWYKMFDADGSDEVEATELFAMLETLQVKVDERLAVMLFRLFDRHDEGFFTFKDFVDILTGRMRPAFMRIVRAERERYRLHGLDIKPGRKKKVEIRKEIEYRDRVVERIVEKEVVKEVKQKPKYYEVENLFQQAAPAQPIIEDVQYVKRPEIVEQEVVVPRVTRVRKEKEKPPEQVPVIKPPPMVVAGDVDDGWGEDSYRGPTLKMELTRVFEVHEATMTYRVMSGADKFYFSLETKALHQTFNLYNTVYFGKEYEGRARQMAADLGVRRLGRSELAKYLDKIFRPELEALCEQIVDEKRQPETWIPALKQAVKDQFSR